MGSKEKEEGGVRGERRVRLVF